MTTPKQLLRNFFTHKDFLPPPNEWPGTLFSPMQILFCLLVAAFIVFAAFRCAKKSEKYRNIVFLILWAISVITEPINTLWEAAAAETFYIEWEAALPFWPCSIYLFVLPFAVFGKGNVRWSACGYMCTLGLLGGTINFLYPATYISRYSCISFAGFRTIFFHGSIVFTALTMLLSGYHSFKRVTTLRQVLLPIVPALIISIPANIVNLIFPTFDYMFFKLESFFFAPIGRATPMLVSVIITYFIYAVIHCVPYLPSYLANRKRRGLIEADAFPQDKTADTPETEEVPQTEELPETTVVT